MKKHERPEPGNDGGVHVQDKEGTAVAVAGASRTDTSDGVVIRIELWYAKGHHAMAVLVGNQ